MVVRHKNQQIVGGRDRRDDEEDARPGWSVWGGGVLFRGSELNNKKVTKIKYDKGLRWPPFDILHATTNQKHAGVMEGGWDRPHNHARTLGEHDGNDEPLAEGDDDDDHKYGKDGNIPNNDNKYAICVDSVDKLLDEGDNECGTLSAAPARACPESQWPSVPSY